MGSKARTYAEKVLGVHEVFEEVKVLIDKLDNETTRLDKAQDDRRRLEEEYADREVELISEMRGIHPSMTDTRFKSEWKGWERSDQKLRSIRIELNNVKSILQGIEYDMDILRTRIKIGCARMTELGGYLNYLAAVTNQAEQTVNPQESRNE